MLISSPLIYFYKFALIFQHISRLLLNVVNNIEEITLTSATGGICARGEGVWRRRLVTYDNGTYLSVVGRISVRGEGAWRRLAMYPDNFTYNICAGGGGVAAAVTNTHARAGTSVGRKFISSQNGGPWDKTS